MDYGWNNMGVCHGDGFGKWRFIGQNRRRNNFFINVA
jgi:hypothetical protein